MVGGLRGAWRVVCRENVSWFVEGWLSLQQIDWDMRKINIGLWLMVTMLCAGCSGSDEGAGDVPEPEPSDGDGWPKTQWRSVQIGEVVSSDAQPVSVVQTYRYDGEGRIVLYEHEQWVSAGGEEFVYRDEASVSFTETTATVADDSGNTWVYTLGSDGRAVACLWTAPAGTGRQYTFSYQTCTDGKVRLREIAEWVDGSQWSGCRLDWGEDGRVRVSQSVDGFVQGFTLTDMSAAGTSNRGELPALFLSELYPLSLHHIALYGKLLGEPSAYLIESVVPDAEAGSSEVVTYQYVLDRDGFVTSCQQVTAHQEEGDVSREYKRTLLYDLSGHEEL